MSKNIGIFVDTSDLYHKVKRQFNSKLCYDAYYEAIKELGTIQQAFAYVMQTEQEARGFITCLKATGFTVRYKRPRIMKIDEREVKRCDWGVGISVDIIKTIGHLNTIVLGTTNSDFIPLINWIKDQGVNVIILAAAVPRSLANAVNSVIEITEEYLEEEEE